jgi:hypothetical protein
MSKIITAFAFATFLSLPAFAAVPSSTPNERAAKGEITTPRIIVQDTKAQEPRIRVAPGCGTHCMDLDEFWGS